MIEVIFALGFFVGWRITFPTSPSGFVSSYGGGLMQRVGA